MQKTKVARVQGDNGDILFDSTGDLLLDFLSQGADTILDRKSASIRTTAERFRQLAVNAFESDPMVAMKIARFFRDQTQQGLKEQALLMIAVLHDRMTSEEIMSILTVHADPSSEGAVREDRIDLLDTVRMLSWHKFFHGKQAQIGSGLLAAFSKIFSKRQGCLAEVLKYKTKTLPYSDDGKLDVGILEILGIIKNGTRDPVPADVKAEFEGYLYPKYRQKDNSVEPISDLAKEQQQYHKGNLPPGVVPQGITIEQVLQRGDEVGLATLARENRLSGYQVNDSTEEKEQLSPDGILNFIKQHYL